MEDEHARVKGVVLRDIPVLPNILPTNQRRGLKLRISHCPQSVSTDPSFIPSVLRKVPSITFIKHSAHQDVIKEGLSYVDFSVLCKQLGRFYATSFTRVVQLIVTALWPRRIKI